MRSTTHHRTLTTLAVASVVTMFAAGCGEAPADRRASELKDSTAEVSAGARAHVTEPWERLAREQYWADQDIHDGWEHLLIAENERRLKAAGGSKCD